MIYVLLIVIISINIVTLVYVWDVVMDLCSIFSRVDRTYDIVNKWSIYYVSKESCNGNNEPFDFIFPNDREDIEEQMRQEECHIDNEKE